MCCKFTFVSQFLFPVTKVSLIGDFNGWSSDPNVLAQESENSWSTELELEAGSYGYKFLINDIVRINDPTASTLTINENGEIASAISIGQAGTLKPDIENSSLKLSSFRFTRCFDIEDAIDENNDVYILGNDRNVVCRLLLNGANWKHVVNCFWYTPENSCFSVSENIITPKGNESSDEKTLWFWMNLQDQKVYPGNWAIQIFIDGVMAHQGSFCIEAKERAFSVPDICDIPCENNPKIPVDTQESSNYLLEDITFTEEFPDQTVEDADPFPNVYDMEIPFEEIAHINIENYKYTESQNSEGQIPDNNEVDLFDLTGVADDIQDFMAASEQSSPMTTGNNDNNVLESFETDIPLFDEVFTPIEQKKDTEKNKEEPEINVINLFKDLDI